MSSKVQYLKKERENLKKKKRVFEKKKEKER